MQQPHFLLKYRFPLPFFIHMEKFSIPFVFYENYPLDKTDTLWYNKKYGGVAQLVRAHGSHP